MMTLKNILFLFLFSGLFYACKDTKVNSNSSKSEVVEKVADTSVSSVNTISRDTFDVWKQRWDGNYRNYFMTDSLHYFDMPLADLGEVLTESPIDNARFFLGMSSDMIPHLMLVGTYNGVVNYSLIADYTKACPPSCG